MRTWLARPSNGRPGRLSEKPDRRRVYVKMAPGQQETDFKTGTPMVMKLKRSLCGLARSRALWHRTIDTAFLDIGFIPTTSDPCVYTYGRDSALTILTIYVDDILFSGANQKVQWLKKAIMNRFAMTGMGEALSLASHFPWTTARERLPSPRRTTFRTS